MYSATCYLFHREAFRISALPKFEVEINTDKCRSRYEERFSGSVIAR